MRMSKENKPYICGLCSQQRGKKLMHHKGKNFVLHAGHAVDSWPPESKTTTEEFFTKAQEACKEQLETMQEDAKPALKKMYEEIDPSVKIEFDVDFTKEDIPVYDIRGTEFDDGRDHHVLVDENGNETDIDGGPPRELPDSLKVGTAAVNGDGIVITLDKPLDESPEKGYSIGFKNASDTAAPNVPNPRAGVVRDEALRRPAEATRDGFDTQPGDMEPRKRDGKAAGTFETGTTYEQGKTYDVEIENGGITVKETDITESTMCTPGATDAGKFDDDTDINTMMESIDEKQALNAIVEETVENLIPIPLGSSPGYKIEPEKPKKRETAWKRLRKRIWH
jgi:hypothetical protein